jgi:hypothetical protein
MPGTAGCRARGHASPDQAVPVPGHRRHRHQASSGLYLKVIKTNREALDVSLIQNPGGTVSLLALADNLYVTAENAGASPLIANRTAIGTWEQFDLITG